jgi:two-component system, sensor histidine kinase LadS
MLKIIILVILILSTTLSSNVLRITNDIKVEAKDFMYYIEDRENKFTFEDIKENKNLKKMTQSHIGLQNGPFWTKLEIINPSNEIQDISIYNQLSGMNRIDVFIIHKNNLIKKFMLGDLEKQELRETLSTHSSFNLLLEPNQSYLIISKLENFQIYNIGWEIESSKYFFTEETQKVFYSGLFAGLVLLFCIYNILNFLVYRKYEYLIICAITLSMLSYQFGFHGILYFLNIGLNLEFITAVTWNSSLYGGLFLLLFSFVFFEQYRKYKKIAFLNLAFCVCFFILSLLILYAQFFDESYFKYSWLIALLILTSTLYLFMVAIYMYAKKEVGSLYYLIGEGTLLIGVFLNTLGLFNIIAYPEIVKLAIPFAYIIDLGSLVFALYIKNKIEQENLKNSKLLLIEQSRFNSIGQAIGHVSHQWKNPLTKIGTSITLLETVYFHDRDNLEEYFIKQLPSIKNSLTLMKKSMDEFSTFYKTKNKKDLFFLFNTIKNILDILESKITLKRVKINLDIDEKLQILSHEHILSNIFLILIDNSLDEFSTNENNVISICIYSDNNKTIIRYEDNAGGIKIQPIELVFDYFISSKNDKDGSGIGLAVAKLLVTDRLKGNISVKNSQNGAIFELVLPQKV